MPDQMLRQVTADGYAFASVAASNTIKGILAVQHGITGRASRPLGAVMIGTLLLATRLKGRGILTLELRGDGLVDYLRVDAMGLGSMRVLLPSTAADAAREWNGVDSLLGQGTLSITRQLEQGDGTAGAPYRSTMLADSGDVDQLLNDICIVSEQVSARMLVDVTADHYRGLLVEKLPGCEDHQRWEQLLDLVDEPASWQREVAEQDDLAALADMLDRDQQRQDLHQYEVKHYCPCSRNRYLNTLRGFADKQLIELVGDDGQIHCTCDFCHTDYAIPLDEVLSGN